MDEEEVLKELRAILLSAPHGLTGKEVARDFQNFVGTSFPFRKFGFTTVEAYLHSKPHIVRRCIDHGQTIYRAVADDSTQHIADMVSKQKTKKPKSRLSWGYNSNSISSRHFSPPHQRTRSADCDFGLEPSSNRTAVKAETKNVLPHATKHNIAQLLANHPGGIFHEDFGDLYTGQMKSRLFPKNLGFHGMRDLLQSIPDIARLDYSRSPTGFYVMPSFAAASSHTSQGSASNSIMAALEASRQHGAVGLDLKREVWQIVCSRPNGLWAGRFALEYENRYSRPFPHETLGYSGVVELLSTIPDACTVRRPTATSDFIIYPPENSSQWTSGGVSASNSNGSTPDDCPPLEENIDAADEMSTSLANSHLQGETSMQAYHADRNRTVSNCERLLGKTTLSRLLSMIQSKMPSGLKCTQAASTYQRMFNGALDVRKLGFHNVETLFSIMSDYVIMEPLPDGDNLVKLQSNVSSASTPTRTVAETTRDGSATSPISTSPSRQHNIAAAIDCSDQAGAVSRSSSTHTAIPPFQGKKPSSASIKQGLNASALGLKLPVSLAGIRHPKNRHDPNPQSQHSATTTATASTGSAIGHATGSRTSHNKQHQGVASSSDYRRRVGSHSSGGVGGGVGAGVGGGRRQSSVGSVTSAHRNQDRFSHLPQEGDQCDVAITHVKSPHDFYVQVIGEKTSGKIAQLSSLMNSVYEDRTGTNYTLNSPEVGSECATLFEDGYWYRATVLRKLPDGQYLVYYPDYGNESQVSSKCLRTLRSDMLELPAQAVHCCLHDVPQDRGGSWPAASKQVLQDQVYQTLRATVHSVDHREKVAVTLTTKTGGSLNKQVLKTVIPASTTTASSAGSGQQRVLATASTSSHGSRSTASASAGG
eukprot:scpid42251/ scgid2925/ RING finger protein 17